MPLDIRIRFGRAIRRIREEQGINQEEAAERCGLHRTYYSGIERGVRNVSLVNNREGCEGAKDQPSRYLLAYLSLGDQKTEKPGCRSGPSVRCTQANHRMECI